MNVFQLYDPDVDYDSDAFLQSFGMKSGMIGYAVLILIRSSR